MTMEHNKLGENDYSKIIESMQHSINQQADVIAEQKEMIDALGARRCEVCGYMEHHREHTGCLRNQVIEQSALIEKLGDALINWEGMLDETHQYPITYDTIINALQIYTEWKEKYDKRTI